MKLKNKLIKPYLFIKNISYLAKILFKPTFFLFLKKTIINFKN